MAIAVVNSTATFNGASSSTIASSALSMTTGNTVAVFTRCGLLNDAVSGVADTAGNTYVPIVRSGDWTTGGGTKVEYWLATNITGHASNVVTVTFATAVDNRAVSVAQLSGVATTVSAAVHAFGAFPEQATTTPSGAYALEMENAAMLVAFSTDTTGSTWTAGTDFTSVVSDASTVTFVQIAIVTSLDNIVPASSNSGAQLKTWVYMVLREPSSGGNGAHAFAYIG